MQWLIIDYMILVNWTVWEKWVRYSILWISLNTAIPMNLSCRCYGEVANLRHGLELKQTLANLNPFVFMFGSKTHSCHIYSKLKSKWWFKMLIFQITDDWNVRILYTSMPWKCSSYLTWPILAGNELFWYNYNSIYCGSCITVNWMSTSATHME